jgi:hypothetical protein
MIPRLIWRHEIIHSLAKPLLITVTTVSLMLNILAFQMAKTQSEALVVGSRGILAQFVFLIPFVVILWMGRADNRCRPWEAGLPVPSRSLWWAHVGALVLATVLLIGVSSLAFVGFGSLIGAFSDKGVFRWLELRNLVARPAAASVTAAFLVALWRPASARLASFPGWTRYKMLVLVGAIVLMTLLLTVPPVFAAVPVAMAGLWAMRTSRALPSAFDLGGTGNGDGLRAGEAADWTVSAPSARVVRIMVLRTLFKWPVSWIGLGPIALLFGMMMSGTRVLGLDEPYLRYMNFFMTVYILFAMSNHFMENLYKVDHLPLDRRTLFRWMVLPVTLFFIAGYGGGRLVEGASGHRTEDIVFENSEEGYGLKVSPGAWQFSATGEPPVVTAPWGESYIAASVPVLKGLPGFLWKPFTTPLEASPEFVAWQISRAVKAVHGLHVPPEEIRERYLESGSGGRVSIRPEGMKIMADFPEARPMYLGPVFPFWVGGELICLMLVNMVYFRAFRPGITIRKGRIVFWSLMGGLMALHIGGYVLFIKGLTEEWIITGFWMGVTRKIGAAGPVGITAAWLVAALLLALAWRGAEKVFLKAEAPSS